MTNVEPLAYFITWTVYGTYLQGDPRGWRRRHQGFQPGQPRLVQWHASRLKHDVVLLSPELRDVVELECQRHCSHRGWRLFAINARSNHVHAVVTAGGVAGKIVRDQLKANSTRAIRERDFRFRGRPVWTVGGDWQCVNSEDELETVCFYVRDAQDRMDRR